MSRDPSCGNCIMFQCMLGVVTYVFTLAGAGAVSSGDMSDTAGGGVKDYCQAESMNATCPHGYLILMEQALYGRMKPGRCIQGEGQLGCSTDVLSALDAQCSGLESCIFHVRNLVDVRACRKDFTPYLEASYTCVQVPGLLATSCGSEPHFSVPVAGTGYFTSVPTRTHVGTRACPWIIKVQRGQRINLTLLDFTLENQKKDSGNKLMSERCPMQVIVEEVTTDTKHVVSSKSLGVCSRNKQRQRALYTSERSILNIYVQDSGLYSSRKAPFLIRYEAIGCPDPTAQTNAWVRRMGETLVAKCNNTDETWYLTCHHTQWIGEIGNCTEQLPDGASEITGYGTYVPHGILLAVLIGIILGVCIGSVMLLAVHCHRRRSKRGGSADVPAKNSPCLMKQHDHHNMETYPALLMDVEQSSERHLCHAHCASMHAPPAYFDKEYIEQQQPGVEDVLESSPHHITSHHITYTAGEGKHAPRKCANIDRKNMYELPAYISGGGGHHGGGPHVLSTLPPSLYFEHNADKQIDQQQGNTQAAVEGTG